MSYICLMQYGQCYLADFIEAAERNNYSAVVLNINANTAPYDPSPCNPTYPDNVIRPDMWNKNVVFSLGDGLDCDSPNDKYRKFSQNMLLRDKEWADHLQNYGFLMISLKKAQNVCLRSIMTRKIKGSLLVRVPLVNPDIAAFEYEHDKSEEEMFNVANEDTWYWWNQFHMGCNFHSKVKVVLDLNERPTKEVVRRWLGEPIESIIVPSTLFVPNRHNFAVLSKEWQVIISHFISIGAGIIISTNATDSGVVQYADYMRNMINKHRDNHFAKQYEDILEIPLQPLTENLDSYTYELFEKDPIKYRYYQMAIEQALLDRVAEKDAESETTIVMVLGAGRGPLVRAVFNAAEITNRKIRVYIIEKNANAIRTVSNFIHKMWPNKDVHLFSKDMRTVVPHEKADILVSELLGSFSDNELSPECLDGSIKLLKPDGLSIPASSKSYINPIMSSKLYNNLRELKGNEKAFDSAYVVLLKNIYNIDEPKGLFEFKYPNRAKVVNNERYEIVHFKASADCVIHGIAGYFDTVLYKDIKLSINPLTHTVGMISWFPMLFPLEPIPLKKNDDIVVHFWRHVSDCTHSVWYEWCLEKPICTRIYNVDGVGYNMIY